MTEDEFWAEYHRKHYIGNYEVIDAEQDRLAEEGDGDFVRLWGSALARTLWLNGNVIQPVPSVRGKGAAPRIVERKTASHGATRKTR